jgi:hypothetical protein
MKKKIEILQSRVLDRAENNMPRIQDVIKQIETEDTILGDTLVNSNEMRFGNEGNQLIMQYGQHERVLNPYSTKQTANRFGVPTPYINTLMDSDWGRKLAVKILNETAKQRKPERVLVRSVGDTVRGVLSDSYKRINSMQIFMAFMEAAVKTDARIYDAAIDDTKSFIEVIQPEIHTIETPRNGEIDVVFGAELRNSDYGDGRLNLRTFMLNVVCLNGMIGTKFLNEVHRGGRLPENLVLSEATYEKESAAQASLVTDSMQHLFNADNMKKEVERIQHASDTPMDFETGIKDLKRTKHYSENELTMLTQKLLNNNPDDGVQGENTKWKFVQGLTAVANEYNTTRRNELIEYASDLMK